jgi:hypothetical protein
LVTIVTVMLLPDIVSFQGVGDEMLLYPQGGHSGHVVMTPLHSASGDCARVLHGHVDDVCAIQVRSICLLLTLYYSSRSSIICWVSEC